MHTTPVSLLKRLRTPEDRSAWPEFVAIYAPVIGKFSERLSLPDADVADLTQDLFIVLLRRMPSFDYDRAGKFRGYLWKCFLNLSRRWYSENRGTWPATLEVASEDRPAMEDKEFQEFVMARALQVMQRRFEEQVWKAFVEFRLNGRSAREVGEMLGIPEANVWTYSGRVLTALREELKGLLD